MNKITLKIVTKTEAGVDNVVSLLKSVGSTDIVVKGREVFAYVKDSILSHLRNHQSVESVSHSDSQEVSVDNPAPVVDNTPIVETVPVETSEQVEPSSDSHTE